jgi:hypothetical protein
MKTFCVLQAINPTFTDNESLIIEQEFERVARGEAPDETADTVICEYAFRATNSIDELWSDVAAAQFGLKDVVRSRSTSVGDVVRVMHNGESRDYLCQSFGWKLVGVIEEEASPKHATVTTAE